MKRIMMLSLVLAAALSLGSCRRAVERAAEKIRLEEIERVERQGLTGAEVVVRIANGTAHRLVLDDARVDVFYAGSRAVVATLREGVEVDSRTTQSVRTSWRLAISDPLALFALARKVAAGDISQVAVSVAAEGRGGPVPVNISREMVPLSEFLNTFGVTLEDVKNYLR